MPDHWSSAASTPMPDKPRHSCVPKLGFWPEIERLRYGQPISAAKPSSQRQIKTASDRQLV